MATLALANSVSQIIRKNRRIAAESVRFRFFEAVADFLHRASQSNPLVLVCDDLHSADEASLKLLEYVARESSQTRLLIIGTYRDIEVRRGHPLTHTLGELSREQLFERINLRGLTETESGRLLELISGSKPPRDLTRDVFLYTEGNPLYVSETANLLVQQRALGQGNAPEQAEGSTGGPRSGAWPLEVPEGVQEVIGMRLDRLTDSCNTVLITAAIIGREFRLEILIRLEGQQDEEQILKALEEALAAGLIQELPDGISGYRFAHTLVQETLVEQLTRTTRVRLHARIAGVLEDLYGEAARAHVAELVHHYARAEAVLGPEKLVHYAQRAGKQALAAYAHEDARGRFEQALEAKGQGPMDEQRADLLYGLAYAQAVTLHVDDRPADLLVPALDHYFETGKNRKAVLAASNPMFFGWGSQMIWMAGMVQRALSLVPEGSHDAGNILCQYGYYLYLERGEFEAALNALQKALLIALREEAMELELRTRVYITLVYQFECMWAKGLEQALCGMQLIRHIDDIRTLLRLYEAVLITAFSCGDIETARARR